MKFALAFVFISLFVSSVGFSQGFYQYNGKTYSDKNLDAKIRQSIFDAENVRYKTILGIIEDKILDDHIHELVSKQKKSHKEIEAMLFKVKPPSERDMKKFYNDQKDSIPYDYAKVKDKIKELMLNQKKFEVRDALIAKLKKKGKFKYSLKEPVAPVFEIKTDGYASKGKANAKLKVVEFADYQCPHCRQAHSIFKKVLKKMGRKIHYVYVDFPINSSGVSKEMAKAGYCVRQKSPKNYWKYHDYAFENQGKISYGSAIDFAKKAKVYDKSIDTCMKSPSTIAFVENSLSLGKSVGVSGTPGIYVNGKRTPLSGDADSFIKVLKKML